MSRRVTSPCRFRLTSSGRWTWRDEELPTETGFGALTAFAAPEAGAAELRYESPSARRLALLGQAALWIFALVVASRLRMPAWRDRRTGGDRRAVIDLAEDVELPTDAGDVPVMAPLEPVGVAAVREPAGSVSRRSNERPLFRPDDEQSRAAWVEEMFANDDEDRRVWAVPRSPGLGGAQESRQ